MDTSAVLGNSTLTGLTLRNITCSYGRHTVLHALNLTAKPGRIYALLGPNGAGKSTALSVALGLLKPKTGHVEILGKPWSRTALSHVGASINGPALFPQLSARGNLLVHCQLTGTDPDVIDPVLNVVNLSGVGRKRAKSFSMGMQMRLALAIAMITDPEVLILDEPQNGLDPQGIIELRDLLRSLAQSGKTVVVSSHQLGEMTRMADDVGVLVAGRLVYEGALDGLADRTSSTSLEEAYLSLVSTAVPQEGLR
ncbi:ABC transporter ATP-binding protein [Schaalia vaccimaxillae]|uniref:ABC transporter ATP-binding protein n=1 Tax=Schaalia vaccimaxillae TaxID=183916 RepID=UPI0003B5907D|nr:ATP-binding cassette domain-containing protein [Schaalia vaccimaxillae]